MLVAGLPPAVVKAPPAYTSLPDTASALTSLFIPEPRFVQLLPFQYPMSTPLIPTPPLTPPAPLPPPPQTRHRVHVVFHPRTQRCPTAPVPFSDVIGRAAARHREPAPRIQVPARHRQRRHTVVHPRTQVRPTAPVP